MTDMTAVQRNWKAARQEEELDRLWREGKERERNKPRPPEWLPWESEAAMRADMQLCYQLDLISHLLNPTNERIHAIVKPYRDALNKAFELGKTGFIDPSEIEGVRPSFWPYASEADYLVDHQLLRLIGMELKGIEKMSPAEIYQKLAIWRDAYRAGAEQANREAAPDPEPAAPEVVELVDEQKPQQEEPDEPQGVTTAIGEPPQELRPKGLIQRLLG